MESVAFGNFKVSGVFWLFLSFMGVFWLFFKFWGHFGHFFKNLYFMLFI